MGITLDIAEDLLLAVKERAQRQKHSVGDLSSELARDALLDADHVDLRRAKSGSQGKSARLGRRAS